MKRARRAPAAYADQDLDGVAQWLIEADERETDPDYEPPGTKKKRLVGDWLHVARAEPLRQQPVRALEAAMGRLKRAYGHFGMWDLLAMDEVFERCDELSAAIKCVIDHHEYFDGGHVCFSETRPTLAHGIIRLMDPLEWRIHPPTGPIRREDTWYEQKDCDGEVYWCVQRNRWLYITDHLVHRAIKNDVFMVLRRVMYPTLGEASWDVARLVWQAMRKQ